MTNKPSILIVEDDQDTMQHLLKGLLSKRRDQYDPVVCVDGWEAIEIIEQRAITILVLDLDMANLNGIETLQEMRKREWLGKIPVIISSGYIDESMKEQLASFGVHHYLKKPYPMKELIDTIDGLLAIPTVS